MMAVPNQKVLKIHNEYVKMEETPYMLVPQEDLWDAMRNLNGESFKLWCFYASHSDGFMWEHSPQALVELGFSKNYASWSGKAMVELREKGYIEENDGKYIFHRRPVEVKKVEVEKPKEKREFIF